MHYPLSTRFVMSRTDFAKSIPVIDPVKSSDATPGYILLVQAQYAEALEEHASNRAPQSSITHLKTQLSQNESLTEDALTALEFVLHQLSTDEDLQTLVSAPQKYAHLEGLVRTVLTRAGRIAPMVSSAGPPSLLDSSAR